MDKITIDTYNKMAIDYDNETADFWQTFPSGILNTFAEKLEGRNVINIGSGPGRDALLLQEHGCKVICLDASSKMVEMCQAKGLEAIEGDFMQIPFTPKSFDGVWAYTSLLHIPKADIGKAFEEISRVIKVGGYFGLGLIEGSGELYRNSSGINQPRYFAFYTRDEIEKLMSEFGFEVIFFDEFKPQSKKYLNFVAKFVGK
jgi:ubiquinone/menaquinone biosynthesis C-methylase UbiE